MKKNTIAFFIIIVCLPLSIFAQIPVKTLVQISRAEDELRFDKTLEDLMKNADSKIRTRAALAAGRIGDEAAIPALVNLLENDDDENVRVTAAFALGEIESIKSADAVFKNLYGKDSPKVRVRAIEAAGKIAAANAKDEKSKVLGEAILGTLDFESKKRSGPYSKVIEFGLTAVLRARPADAEKTLVKFIRAYTPQIRANALNALARLRAKNANEQARKLLQTDTDAIVRANAARVLGAAEDKDAFDLLLNAAINDKDSRVRVSAIRAVGILKDAKAADKLLERGEKLLADYKKSKFTNPVEKSELLEIATILGNLLINSDNQRAVKFLDEINFADKYQSAEYSTALIKIKGKTKNLYDGKFAKSFTSLPSEFRVQAVISFFQSFGEIPKIISPDSKVSNDMEMLNVYKKLLLDVNRTAVRQMPGISRATPDFLRTYAEFKNSDLSQKLTENLKNDDIFTRATAAELLGEQTVTKENVEALKTAFVESLKTDKQYNDAQLAILSALVKLDKTQSFESLRLALTAPDYLVRKHAATLIKQNDLTKDFSNVQKLVGTVKPYNPKTGTKLGQTLNKEADYRRAVSRKNGTVKAVLTTEKGKFTIEFLPEDAPLTVDNFIKLAKSNYFNGVSVHRVVPNFVMQDGDPRGDGNGGPGYSIRCEMNMIPYERGAVGMALSGKDTGGSQWFVTHSPQPHLDGGYTVFGRVNEADMKIVDQIVRGDKILKVEIIEEKSPKK